jgi:hypothetical protein
MTLDIKDSVFRAYEEYVMKDKNLEEGAKGLITVSDDYRFLKCMDLLTKKKLDLTKEELEYVKKYMEADQSRKAKKITLRFTMLEYDAAKTKEEKQQVLERITKDILHLNFNYQKPGNLAFKAKDKKEIKEKKQENILESVKIENYFDKLYKRQTRPNDFSKKALLEVDLEKLHKDDFFSVIEALEKDLPMMDDSKFYEKLAVHIKDTYDSNSDTYNLASHILNNMTIDQMDKSLSKIPDLSKSETFMHNYINKKFSKELDEKESSHSSDEEKRKSLIKLYEYAKTLPQKLVAFKSWILLELLHNGIRINNYDEKYFIEYLKAPVHSPFLRKPAVQEGSWHYLTASLSAQGALNIRDRELLEKYLEHFFLEGAKTDKFAEYLENQFLREVWENTMLMAGKDVNMNANNTARLENLGSQVRIKIQPNNKDCFKPGEDISLKVELKNVPTLFVKVFEINTENYYRKTMDYFKTDINLDGLVASIEKTIEHKEPPQIRFYKELTFPELKDKLGLYVIELIGNGKSSRAIIKIGSLSLITHETAAGQICYILDSERKVCCDESTGIWMDNTYFKASIEKKGRIVVPYHPSSSNRQVNAILMHKGMAQLVQFTRIEECYNFKCGFYLLPESVILGKTANIIIRPHLTINRRTASLSLLKNIKCILNTSTYLDSIPATRTFNDLKVTDNDELVISFQVGASIDSLRITVNAEVQNVSKNTKQYVADSHSFCISNYESVGAIGEFYLQLNDKNEYSVSLLGKNGEPLKDESVKLVYKTDICSESKDINAETDDKGCVSLGKMKGITTLKATYNQTNSIKIEKCWKLPSRSVMQYPEYVDIIEGEDVEFPVSLENSKSVYLLRSRRNGANIENLTKLVKIEEGKNELYGVVKIKGLKEGEYLLTRFDNDSTKIQVHKGVYWKENDKFILKDYSLLENAEKQGFVKIKSVNFEDGKDGKAQMHIEVKGATKDKCRVHVMLFKYVPENLNALTLRLLAKDAHITSEHFFEEWKNMYLPERELGTELRYCFDRRNQDRFMGNTLEKPRLVLRRNFLKSTHTLQEQVTQGSKYESRTEAKFKKSAYGEKVYAADRKCRGKVHGSDGYVEFKPNEDNISAYQNFLATEPLVKLNCIGDAEGKLIVELEEKFKEDYGCALVLAVDKGSVAHYLLPLPGKSFQKRDLSLSIPLNAEKSYSEVRSTKCLKKLETYVIEDITSTSIQLIDSLEKVALVNRILLGMDCRNIEHLDNFEELLKWYTMSKEEKNRMTSRYGSHELNLFVYKKDPDYFKKTIRPHLLNKMEKTFTDYYLLEDFNVMLRYANTPELYTGLHYLEKALLVERLALGGKTELAKTIAQRMKDFLLVFKKDLAKQNRTFDAVLSLGELKTAKEKEAELAILPNKYYECGASLMAIPRCCCECCGCLEDSNNSNYYFAACEMDDVDMEEIRQVQKPALEELGETKEYCETNYYSYAGAYTDQGFISKTEFWVDYAMNCIDGKEPFLSSNFIYSHENLVEVMAGFALLDLPFTSADHGYITTEGRGIEYKAASNLIIFQKEIRETKENINNSILIAQKYTDPDNKNDESKIEEFLVNKVYEGQVIIANITPKELEFDLLVQIPQGALPLGSAPYQKSYSITLDQYKTNLRQYLFYFPTPGKFKHTPASVSIDSIVVAKAPAEVLNVVIEKTTISQENFREIVSTGDYNLILKVLKDKPLDGIKTFSWEDLTWLFKDPKFYTPFINLMKEQHRFMDTLWSFSLYHKDREDLIIEYLNTKDYLKRECGYYFDSTLFAVRPINVGVRHLDYYPLINPRAHKNLANTPDNSQPMILNEDFYKTYKTFILYLIEKPVWDLADNMNLIYYLILQDRTTEAINKFAKLGAVPDGILKLQYDYMAAYLDFYTGAPGFKKAREIVAKYINYPLLSWKLLFADIDQQLKEYDGASIEEKLDVEEEERKERKQKKLLGSEAQLDISLDGKDLLIVYNGMPKVMVKYYIIDLEILFSHTPFLAQSTDDFSFVQPNSTEWISLDPKVREQRVKIPEKYIAKNVVVEVSGAGLQKLVTHFSTTMKVQIFENYGELKVTDARDKLIPKVYVKAFIKKRTGEVSFYKDGYTDIRGRFDYVSLNASELPKVEKFALFIMSDDHGSLIRECLSPSTTIRPEPGFEPFKPRLANYYK